MRFTPSRGGALALAGLCVSIGCEGGGNDRGDGGDGPTDVVVASCSWQPAAPLLALPRSEVRGTLRGTSRNASTTCTRSKGAGGPEAIYTLRVTERTVVDLEVVSSIDTVVAIRRDCVDPLTELACNDTPPDADPSGGSGGTGGSSGGAPTVPVPVPPPGFPVDAAADGNLPPGNNRDGHLRAALDPGTYFVIVDESEAFGVGGDYVLKVNSTTPPAQSSCLTALPISDGTSLAAEQLDLASGTAISCSGGTPRPALFYKATVPSGQRLTVRANATRGDRAWSPVLQVLDACAQTAACLAVADRQTGDGSGVLRYVNNGPSEQSVLVAVGASGPVSGGLYQMSVGIGEPIQNGSCQSARTLTDGLMLRNQDLSEGQTNANPRCSKSPSPSLFYKATLLPQQTLDLALDAAFDPRFGMIPLQVIFYDSCDSFSCEPQPLGQLQFQRTNRTTTPITVIVEVTSFITGLQGLLFNLSAKLPLPKGEVRVSPTGGLQTTEAGGAASFTVGLESPPLQPVQIALRSSDPGEGTVKPTSLSFDASNWSQPQVVTVTGVDDAERDGAQNYTVVVEKAVSQDPRYAGLDGADVQLVNRDDEPGFNLDQTRPAVTSESGGSASFAVTLNRAPTATVRLPIASSDVGEGRPQVAELVFEPDDWNILQTITIVGVDDMEMDGNQNYQLVLGPATSADPAYNGIDPADLMVINTDNEYQRVAAQPISGKLDCPFGRAHVGADQGGRLYVAMQCVDLNPGSGGGPMAVDAGAAPGTPPPAMPGAMPNIIIPPARDAGAADIRPGVQGGPAAFVATSADGGRTFGPPVNTGWPPNEMRIAGTTTEGAVLALIGPLGAMVLRTSDAGQTWQAPSMLGNGFGNLRLAASGTTVVLTFDSDSGPSLWVSADGGRTFNRRFTTDLPSTQAVAVDPSSGAITVVGFDGSALQVRRSTDQGASFAISAPVSQDFFGDDTVAIGPRSVFLANKGNALTVAPLDNLANQRQVGGLGAMAQFPSVLVADGADNLTVLEGNFMALVMHRLVAGQMELSSPKTFVRTDTFPSGVALSDRAVAVVARQGSQILAGVEVWP